MKAYWSWFFYMSSILIHWLVHVIEVQEDEFRSPMDFYNLNCFKAYKRTEPYESIYLVVYCNIVIYVLLGMYDKRIHFVVNFSSITIQYTFVDNFLCISIANMYVYLLWIYVFTYCECVYYLLCMCMFFNIGCTGSSPIISFFCPTFFFILQLFKAFFREEEYMAYSSWCKIIFFLLT